MDLFLPLLLLLAAARIGGGVAKRCGQAPLVGEILGGAVLAALLAPVAASVPFVGGIAGNPAVDTVVDLGIFFLILSAGIEMRPREIASGSRLAVGVALGGMVVPFVAGIGFGWLVLPDSPLKSAQMLVIAVALSISAVPATVEILRELRLLHHRVGRTVVSAAIFDDVLGLVLLAMLLAFIRNREIPDAASLLLLGGRAAAFFVVAAAGNILFYRLVGPAPHLAGSATKALSAMVIGALLLAVLAEAAGLHFIFGPFMVGLFFEKRRVGPRTYRATRNAVDLVGQGFLVPVFFAVVGARLDLTAFASIPGTIALLIVIAILGKVLGAGLPALAGGMGRRHALAVGTAMSARGMVELVVLTIALEAGVFATNGPAGDLFSALVITAVATTIAAPLLLRQILADGAGPKPG